MLYWGLTLQAGRVGGTAGGLPAAEATKAARFLAPWAEGCPACFEGRPSGRVCGGVPSYEGRVGLGVVGASARGRLHLGRFGLGIGREYGLGLEPGPHPTHQRDQSPHQKPCQRNRHERNDGSRVPMVFYRFIVVGTGLSLAFNG